MMGTPVDRKNVGYGENKVLSICKWEEGNITLEVRHKEGEKWKTEERINLYEKAQEVLKEMMA